MKSMHESKLSPSIEGALVEVRTSPVGGEGGKGLFASQDMAAGTEVARMIDPARMRRAAWDIYSTALGLPHDACVQVARSPLVFYDQGWQTMDMVPLWYRQNHAREGVANVKMSILNPDADPQKQLLVWRTIRAVRRGDELRFTYTDVPVTADVVTFDLVISGSMDSFGTSAKESLKTNLRAKLNCNPPACLLEITLSSASVKVGVKVTIPRCRTAPSRRPLGCSRWSTLVYLRNTHVASMSDNAPHPSMRVQLRHWRGYECGQYHQQRAKRRKRHRGLTGIGLSRSRSDGRVRLGSHRRKQPANLHIGAYPSRRR